MKKRVSKKPFKGNSYVKIPSALLDMKQDGMISSNALTVCAYLLSLQSASKAVNGFNGVQVSRERISLRCGICARTVGNILKSLSGMGFIRIFSDQWHGGRQSNVYVIGEPLFDLSGGFFYVPRRIFKKGLSPNLLLVYFFLCHAQNHEYCRSWNSYSDIARRLRMNRGKIIKLIKTLECAGYITKKRRLMQERGKGVRYVDNAYSVVWLLFFSEKKDGQLFDRQMFSFFVFCRKMKTKIMKQISSLKYSANPHKSQALYEKNLEYEISVALLRLEEIKSEQLLIPMSQETLYKRDESRYKALFEGFPF
ncbi:MAG: helix-turn-helix domain-containing protein [Oscillospiraceae bacterium]|nr:helix-turn-helix domain-containing protein [Oscillospiraceae bacterium]